MGMKDDEDKELIEKSQHDDLKAFEMLIEKYKQKIFKHCYFKHFWDDYRAEEAAHQTFIKAYKGIKGFRGESAFYTWLYSIAENVCKDILKEPRNQSKTTTESDIPPNKDDTPKRDIFIDKRTKDPAFKLEEEETIKTVRNCMKKLSQGLRDVLVHRYYNNLKYKHIAKKLNILENTAKTRMHKAVKKLQDCLRKKGLLK